MQERDKRVQLLLMYGPQALAVAHHVAKRDKRVHLVQRRTVTAAFHEEIGDDKVEGLVIGAPDIALDAHQLIGFGSSANFGCQCLHRSDDSVSSLPRLL